jgi:hypothetical protein
VTAPLSHFDLAWDAWLSDVPRAAAWSPGGRLLIAAADGTTLVDHPGQISRPIGPDPVAAAWLDESHAIVADRRLGVYTTGRPTGVGEEFSATTMKVLGSTAVVATEDRLAVHHGVSPLVPFVASRCGRVRDLAPITETIWVVVGRSGWTILDVQLDAAEAVIAEAGCLTVVADLASARYAIADVAGSIHVATVGHDVEVQQLDGYPDRVRHLAWTPGGNHLVVAIDDELTWWPADDEGRMAPEPRSAVGHDAPISVLAVSDGPALVMTGDANGVLCLWSERLVDRPVARWELGDEIVLAVWRRAGDELVVGTAGGYTCVFRVVHGEIA